MLSVHIWFLECGKTESTWYVGHSLTYCTSSGWWMMNVELSVEWMTEETKVLREDMQQCCFVHHKSYMNWPRFEHRPPVWEARNQSPELLLAFVYTNTHTGLDKRNSVALVWERTILTLRPLLVGEVSAHVWGYRLLHGQRNRSPWPYSHFSRLEPLLFFQVHPQLYLRGWVDPSPDPLLLKSGSARNRTRTSGSVARNSNHETTEAVYFLLHNIYKFSSYLTGSTIHLCCVARNSDH
jgi:hypothetical protein